MSTLSKKVCLLGDFSVGKTSLVRRFVYDFFEDKYISSIGVKVSRKKVTLAGSSGTMALTFMLWDLAGNNLDNHLQLTYLRGSAGAIIVCDLTRPDTLANLTGYVNTLLQISPDAQVVLAANKKDLIDQYQLSISDLEKFASPLNVPYFLTSAKTGEGVETLFHTLGERIIA